jgi:hypothetical protein
MWFCILRAVSLPLSFIPIISLLNCVIGPASLVMWIVLLVKFAGLKGQIQEAAATEPQVDAGSPAQM